MGDRRSKLASDLQRLQASIGNVIERRETLPQPLFWSLFHARIEKIREARQQERALRAFLFNPYLKQD